MIQQGVQGNMKIKRRFNLWNGYRHLLEHGLQPLMCSIQAFWTSLLCGARLEYMFLFSTISLIFIVGFPCAIAFYLILEKFD